jgi:AraC-like DNA-binding protein
VIEGSIDLIKDKTHYEINEGEIYIINKLEVHEIIVTSKDALILSIQISPKMVSNYFPVINSAFFTKVNMHQSLAKHSSSNMHKKIIEIARLFFTGSQNYELLCVANINLLFHQLFTVLPHVILAQEEIDSLSLRMKRISQITDYIEEHYREKLLLSDIAKIEDLTLTYLSHFFKDTLNMTFQDYLNTRRVEYAKKLFDTTHMNILEVSLESGFSDTRYLSKFFVKYYGYTPIQYKRNLELHDVSSEHHQTHQQFYDNTQSLEIIRALSDTHRED